MSNPSISLNISILLMMVAALSCSNDNVLKIDHRGTKIEGTAQVNYERLQLMYESGSGAFLLNVFDDRLLLYDYHTGYLEEFDENGRYLKRLLFPGRGPNQIDDFWVLGQVDVAENIILGTTFNYMILDEAWNRKGTWKKFQLNRESAPSSVSISLNVFADPGIYTINYLNELERPSVTKDGFLILPVTIRKKMLNAYDSEFNADLYYLHSRSLGLVDIHTGELKRVFAKKPAIYSDLKYLAYLDACFYTLSDDKIYVGHLADSCVYAYTHTGEPLYRFGFSGKEMRLPKPLRTLEEFEEYSDVYTSTEPSYWSLYFDKERSLLFRSYRKSESTGGLQVYSKDDLVLDQEVPWPFFVKGRIGERYYADGYRQDEEDSSTVAFYTFTFGF